MSASVIIKASGLNTSSNDLDRPEGSLTEAENIIIKRDGIIEPRRGFNLYGSQLPLVNERVKQLATYRDRILRHYSNRLAFDSDGKGKFEDFSGSFLEAQVGLRTKFIESNGNFYFTTADGIKKISAKTNSDFSNISGYITPAGAVKAVDLEGELVYTANSQSSFLPQDGAVAYRVLWAYNDANNNLVQGAPSQREIVSNSMLGLLIRDYMRGLDALDSFSNLPLTSARINDKDYVSTLKLNLNSSATELRTNLIALASKLDNDIFIADQSAVAPLQIGSVTLNSGICTVTFSTGVATDYLNPGSNIFLSGFNLATQSEIQTITFSATPTSGNFTLKLGVNESAVIAFNANAATVQSTLRTVTGLSNVVVTGSITSGSGLTLTFPATDGDIIQVVQGGTNSLLNGATPVSIVTATTQNGISQASGSLNDAQVVVTSNATTITFNTTAIGFASLASATINSNEFRIIPEPDEPNISATNQELTDLQSYYSTILTELSALPNSIISISDKIIVNSLDITTTATVKLTITIPEGLNSNYFFQVYRSAVSQATGAGTFDDISPNDELQLVYEAYPTETELTSGFIIIEDVTPDAFRGANLYTNASTGEGILAANDTPPFAKDITRYRNSVFYANTRTKHRASLNLLGVTQMISDFDLGTTPKITITDGQTTNTYSFVTGLQEITEITTIADVADSLNGKYLLINSVDKAYYVYFETTIAIDPAIPNRTGIKVSLATNSTALEVASRLRDKLTIYLDDFIVDGTGTLVEVINYDSGVTLDATSGTTGFSVMVSQQGRGERIQPEITEITTIAGNLYKSSGISDYFTINTTLDKNQFYIWFKRGTSTDPSLSGKSGIQIDLSGSETAADVALLIKNTLSSDLFKISVNSNILTITNIQYGTTTNATEVVLNIGFLVSVIQEGALEVLLSPLISPARAVEQTALSFIRSINKNPGEVVYGYYLSSAFDVPGQMTIEARNLEQINKFYILGNNSNTGLSFNPDIGPEGFISSISAASPTLITTTSPHGLVTGDSIVISSTNSIPNIDGLFSVFVVSPTTLSIDTIVATSGTTGSFIKSTNALFSENEEKSNRVYYSKFQQPEAVPIINYFDVGAQDKAILRVLPLRDSLFVFKEDGLYRISGDSSPFQLNLFDNSFIVLAPDSVSVANNVIYAWTTQGIQSLTEGGSSVISRNIDNIILRIQSSNFINFKTATWATGYESDNSYIVFTVDEENNSTAKRGYRYSTLTQTWTNYIMSPTCGIINSITDQLYLGSSDVAYIEQERKSFSRLDYADRQYDVVIGATSLLSNKIILTSVTDFEIGDVFIQEQTLGLFEFNSLLNKLDLDSGVSDSDYSTLLYISAGASIRSAINSLANKLDTDVGVVYSQFLSNIDSKNGPITSIPVGTLAKISSVSHGLVTGRVIQFDSTDSFPALSGPYPVTVIDANTFTVPVRVITAGTTGNWQTQDSNFNDVKTCYNFITAMLNEDTGVSFNNYKPNNTNTIQESIITAINIVTRQLTLDKTLDYLRGDATVYKAIKTSFVYSPNTMGDPLMLKHLREATLMFEVTNITSATLSFSTDLLPEFIPVKFNKAGNGIFGHNSFGGGFFGGVGNAAPFRTYIPRQCQRCRYIVVRFQHSTARETYAITGVTVTGNTGQSSRAYRS